MAKTTPHAHGHLNNNNRLKTTYLKTISNVITSDYNIYRAVAWYESYFKYSRAFYVKYLLYTGYVYSGPNPDIHKSRGTLITSCSCFIRVHIPKTRFDD